jgi:hypothetical protein
MAHTAATAQSVTYRHDDTKMNQFTVAEIGSGTLTPELYYSLSHSNYKKTAAAKNKLGYRTTTGLSSYRQVDDAEKIDSALTKRAEVEALNIADRTGGALDVAWMAEGDKITSKMSDFQTNINRIPELGGSASQQALWKEHYNVLQTALQATQQAYMPNAQRKKQYLSIYADACRKNEALVKYLVRLSNSEATVRLLQASYTRSNPNAMAATQALSRWRDAGWRTVRTSTNE